MTGLRSLTLAVVAAAGLALSAAAHATAAPPPAPAKKQAVSPTAVALEKAAALRKDGKPVEALEVLRVVCRDVKKQRGVGHPDLLPIYDAAGEILVDTDPYEKAESLYEKSIAIREQLRKRGRLADAAPLGRTWFLLASVRMAAGKVEPALDAARKAVEILDAARGATHADTTAAWGVLERVVATCEELFGAEDPVSVAARETLADMDEAFGRYAAAIDARRETFEALRKRQGDASPEALAELVGLQRLLLETGRAAEAVAAQERLADGEAADRAAKLAQLDALRLLADLHLAAERFSPAAEAMERAVAASESLHGKGHPETRFDRLGLLLVEARRGRGPDAATVTETLSGPEDEEPSPALIRAVARAAEVLLESGDPKSAGLFATRAIDSEEAWPKIPADAAAHHRLLRARSLLAVGSVGEARGLLDEATAAGRDRLGPGHAATLLLQTQLAACEAAEGEPGQATEILRDVFERGLPRKDFPRDRDLVRTIAAVAARAPADAATPLWDGFISLRSNQFGDDHPTTALARLLVGGARLTAGEPQEAVAVLRPAAAALERSLPADHPDVAGALLLLGMAERAAGETDAAEQTLARSLGIWERITDGRFPPTLAAAHALAMTRLASGRPADALPLLERLQVAYDQDDGGDDWRLAEVLVPLGAAYLAKADKDRALAVAGRAAKLQCWQPGRDVPPADLERRALTLADLAGLMQTLGEDDAGTQAKQRAKGLATRTANPKRVMAEVDRRAAAAN